MMDEKKLVSLLDEILGKPERVNLVNSQYSYNCPVCSYEIKRLGEPDSKGNLEINIRLGLYKCWVCCETNGTSGNLMKFFRKFGTTKQRKIFSQLDLEFENKEAPKEAELSLPKEYRDLMAANKNMLQYRQAINYLRKRAVTDDIIKKYKIGFCVDGGYGGRIIIPSFDKNNKLNYFIGRSWYERKEKYKNPNINRENIIFNESNLDFKKDIYIVEGVFDMFFLDNSIPLLGKFLSTYTLERLYNEAKKNIYIALDGDAYNNGVEIYNLLNSGRLRGKIKMIKLPIESDPASLQGKLNEYIITIF